MLGKASVYHFHESVIAVGTGVFLPWVTAYFLVKDTEMVTMTEIVPSCEFLVDCGVNLTLGICGS